MSVTVITTFYNQKQWVDEALDSVLAQEGVDVDLVITDDGSTDGTAEKIAEWCARNRVDAHVVRNAENLGLPATLNKAAAFITGEFFIVFNGDDVLLPGRLAHQSSALRDAPDEVGVVFSDIVVADEFGVPTGRKVPDPAAIHEGDIYDSFITQSFLPGAGGLMVRSDLLKTVGPWNEDLVADDFDFSLRLSRATRFQYVPFDGLLYRVNAGSLTSRQGELAWGRVQALRGHRGQSRERDALLDARIAENASIMHETGYVPRQTRRVLLQSFVHTRRPKPLRQLVESGIGSLPIRTRFSHVSSRPVWPQARLERFIGNLGRPMLLLAGLAVVSSLIEASILLIVASVAASLAFGDSASIDALGPVSLPALSSAELLVGSLGLLALFAVVEVLVSVAGARLPVSYTHLTLPTKA